MNKKFFGFIFSFVLIGLFAVNTVNAADPTITSLSPSTAKIGSPVVINGSNFIGITKVFFGDIDAGGFFTVDSASKITVVVPNGAVTGKVSILTSKGEVFSPGVFTVDTVPAITSLSPSSGKIGATVIINGTNFAGINKVFFGDVDAGGFFTVNSPTKINVIVPKGAVTSKVSLLTSKGEVFSPSVFTIDTAAKITSFYPASLQIGQTVTINGEGFTTVDGVLFGTVDAGLDFKVLSTTQITAKVPAGAISGKITVKTTANGNAVSSDSFSIYIPVGSSPLNFSNLNGIITEVNNRLDNTSLVEGTSTGQYIVGSKAVLKKALDSAEYVSAGGNSVFQSDIDKATSDLQYALNNFELSKVGSSGAPVVDPTPTKKVDYSKSIVPRCNVGGVTEIDQTTGQYKVPCDFTFFMKLLNNIIKFLLFVIATPLVALIIVYVAYLYLTSGGAGQNEKAKQILFRVVIGYVIALAAWLIISTIITSMKVDSDIDTFMGPLSK